MRRTWTGLYVPHKYNESIPPIIGPLDAQDFEKQVHGLAFFDNHPEILRIWEFNADHGELPGLSFEPSTSRIPNSDFRLVSPFVPGKLILHSRHALRAGLFSFRIIHTVLFDANLYDRIVRFVFDRDRLSVNDRAGVRLLLDWLIIRKYDYQLLPYVVESFVKNSPERGYESAFRGTKAILILHTMDRDHFVTTGSIRLDPQLLEYYDRDFGTSNLDRIVEAQLEPYARFNQVPTVVTLSLICLLKMVIIHRCTMPDRSLDVQWAAFDEFVFSRLGVFAGTLRNIALLYFAGKLDRWIRPQRNSKPEAALASLSRCAWDLHLASIPQHILAESPEQEVALCHLCTRDRELASVLSVMPLQMLTVRADGSFKPYLVTNLDLIQWAIGDESLVSLARADERAARFLEDRRCGRVRRIEHTQVDSLLSEATDEFRREMNQKPRQ